MTPELHAALTKFFALPNWQNRIGPWLDVGEALRDLEAAWKAEGKPSPLEALRSFAGGEECECSDCVDEQIHKPGGGSYANRKPGRCRWCVARDVVEQAERK